jgi:hypothetical protein
MQVLKKIVTAIAVLGSLSVGMSSASAASRQQHETRCNVPTSECSVYFGN